MNNDLHKIAKQLVSQHKGILASDEKPSSVEKILKKFGLPSDAESRRKYRELFINTPGIEQYLNAMILNEETFWQNDSAGKPFKDILIEKGIAIVVKLDQGLEELPNFPGEKISLGLDTLKERAEKYAQNNAVAAKWRSVIKIGENLPTNEAIEANSVILSEYALFCQQSGLVPIVEPEILIDGDHTIQQAEAVVTKTLLKVFESLSNFKVDLQGMVLKTSMVTPGNKCEMRSSPQEIADITTKVLLSTVPKEVAGIVFLSGGQSPEEATINLNYIAKKEPLPWHVTFSYLRAIEGPAAEVWQGKDENIDKARDVFIQRLRDLALADSGIYR